MELSSSSSDDDAHRTASRQKIVKEKSSRRKKPPAVESSKPDSDGHVQSVKPRHILKPPKYDESTPLETFWAQFRNCAGYNHWTKTEELAYLCGALEKKAGQVLWDYGTEVTDSLKKLTGILKVERTWLISTGSKSGIAD